MRYIRTENGIYELKENDATQTPEEVQIALMTCNYKSADTIEELCDEFVVKHINNEKPYITDNYQKHDLLKDRQKAYEYGVEIVYGAIWTNKGLIYVAKMNENGELELI